MWVFSSIISTPASISVNHTPHTHTHALTLTPSDTRAPSHTPCRAPQRPTFSLPSNTALQPPISSQIGAPYEILPPGNSILLVQPPHLRLLTFAVLTDLPTRNQPFFQSPPFSAPGRSHSPLRATFLDPNFQSNTNVPGPSSASWSAPRRPHASFARPPILAQAILPTLSNTSHRKPPSNIRSSSFSIALVISIRFCYPAVATRVGRSNRPTPRETVAVQDEAFQPEGCKFVRLLILPLS